jgi:hypothetical protein
MEWHCLHFELNWIEKKWDAKLMEKIFKNILMSMMLRKFNLKKNLNRHHPCLFTCEWAKQTPI